MTKAIKRMETYFDRLVPSEGAADTVAGEIVRALSKITYRFYNDGDRIGIEYGNETCNAPARYLQHTLPTSISYWIGKRWGNVFLSDKEYTDFLDGIIEAALDYIDENDLESQPNKDDMLGYDEEEDYHYDEDEEDDYYEEEPEEDYEEESEE